MKRTLLVMCLAILAFSSAEPVASESSVPTNPLREAYFGETHVHTAYSLDAYIGGARLTPDGAYRFAKGEEVTIHGQKHSIGRPLDFAAVGSTVDLATATYTNEIGSAELMGSWTDPEFDPARGALYYARVLEIPTPRFSTYDAVRNGLPLLADVQATVQERAWSSPIWYAPK